MELKLLSISSLYQGYLTTFYSRNSDFSLRSYEEILELILADSTDFTAAYIKTFRKHGISAGCIIANDNILQAKWKEENAGKYYLYDILGDQVMSFDPDILWIEDFRFITGAWLEDIRKRVKSIKLIIACFCAPFNAVTFRKLAACDLVITCTPGMKREFERNGLRAYLVYHGFDSGLPGRLKDPEKLASNKAVFTGSLFPAGGYHQNRINLIEELLNEEIDIELFVTIEKRFSLYSRNAIWMMNKLAGMLKLENIKRFLPFLEHGNPKFTVYSRKLLKACREPVFGLDMYRLLKSYDVVLNNHGDVAGPYAGNIRLFEATGVGSCLLTDDKENMDELFTRDQEVVVYKSISECVEKLRWLLEHEDGRKAIAAAGQKKTLSCHTVEQRCRAIESIIESELKNRNIT